jgi:hypothetical protein
VSWLIETESGWRSEQVGDEMALTGHMGISYGLTCVSLNKCQGGLDSVTNDKTAAFTRDMLALLLNDTLSGMPSLWTKECLPFPLNNTITPAMPGAKSSSQCTLHGSTRPNQNQRSIITRYIKAPTALPRSPNAGINIP